MRHFDDVSTVIANTRGDVSQHSGAVGNLEDQAKNSSVPEKGAKDRIGQNTGIDVATRQGKGNLAALEHLRVGQNSSQTRRASAFADLLGFFRQRRDSAFDLKFVHYKNFGNPVTKCPEAMIAQLRHGNAFSNCRATESGTTFCRKCG